MTHRYRPEIPEPAPFLYWHGLQLGVFECFHIQNNRDSSNVSAYILQYCSLSAKMSTVHKDRRRILFVFLSICMVSKNPNTRAVVEIFFMSTYR